MYRMSEKYDALQSSGIFYVMTSYKIMYVYPLHKKTWIQSNISCFANQLPQTIRDTNNSISLPLLKELNEVVVNICLQFASCFQRNMNLVEKAIYTFILL